jgi:hypothetical protein
MHCTVFLYNVFDHQVDLLICLIEEAVSARLITQLCRLIVDTVRKSTRIVVKCTNISTNIYLNISKIIKILKILASLKASRNFKKIYKFS